MVLILMKIWIHAKILAHTSHIEVSFMLPTSPDLQIHYIILNLNIML